MDRCVKDHLGNNFENLSAMLRYYGIKMATFKPRIKKGMTLEQALTRPVRVCKSSTNIKDHLGNQFADFKALAEKYKIGVNTLRSRLDRGIPLEEALTRPIHQENNGEEYIDHLGNSFKSLSTMARYYGMGSNALRPRLLAGMPLEEALTKPIRKTKRGVTYKDHLGNEYASFNSLARYYGINRTTLKQRLSKGMTLEQALTEKVRVHK